MIKTIDMQDLRYLKLFGATTKISTRHCFEYNNTLFFCVPKQLMSKAIGEEAKNIKKIKNTIKKRVKIIPFPDTIENFISKIISPVEYKKIETTDTEVILTAGSQNKAALLGRNKRRLLEMKKIIKEFFKKEFKII